MQKKVKGFSPMYVGGEDWYSAISFVFDYGGSIARTHGGKWIGTLDSRRSIAGLTGLISGGRPIPKFAWILAVAAVIAGTAGSHLGSRRFPVRTISIILATVLVLAGCKLIFW